jgi:hypothetical protein
MVSAFTSLHFHGQTLRESRAEIERTGVRLRTGKGSKTAPFGVPSSFVGYESQNPAGDPAGFYL